jgi:hypothetical protein
MPSGKGLLEPGRTRLTNELMMRHQLVMQSSNTLDACEVPGNWIAVLIMTEHDLLSKRLREAESEEGTLMMAEPKRELNSSLQVWEIYAGLAASARL